MNIMVNKIIKIDIDDVLINLLEPWINTLSERYNLNVKVDDVTSWDMNETFPTLSENQIFEVLGEEELWKKVKPNKYAVEYLKKIISDFEPYGYKVKLVTNAHYTTIKYKIDHVMSKYFSFIDYNDFIICKDKYLVKGEFAIDDYYKNFENDDCIRILMDKPYNEKISDELYDYRCNSMKDVYNLLSKVIKKSM